MHREEFSRPLIDTLQRVMQKRSLRQRDLAGELGITQPHLSRILSGDREPNFSVAAYWLHKLGYAHSVETWLGGRLVGGLYGIALGRVFFGESMFTLERDASKVALKRLCDELIARGFEIIDCQMATSHLISLGARLIPRGQFIELLQTHIGDDLAPQPWH